MVIVIKLTELLAYIKFSEKSHDARTEGSRWFTNLSSNNALIDNSVKIWDILR